MDNKLYEEMDEDMVVMLLSGEYDKSPKWLVNTAVAKGYLQLAGVEGSHWYFLPIHVWHTAQNNRVRMTREYEEKLANARSRRDTFEVRTCLLRIGNLTMYKPLGWAE